MVNRDDNICRRIEALESELLKYPDGFLVYKTIHDKKQPYLQWHENGKTKSRYIKASEREEFLVYFEEKNALREQYVRLCAIRDELSKVWEKYPGLGPQTDMINPVGIGNQSFELIRRRKLFYVDKTRFIREWWNNGNSVNLILRPRRFGKSLNLDMVDCFFSKRYEGRQYLFEGLQISKDKEFMKLQGSRPVINFSFSGVKAGKIGDLTKTIALLFDSLYLQYLYILEDDNLNEELKNKFLKTRESFKEGDAMDLVRSIFILSQILTEYHKEKVIILIDEYDTPIIESWTDGAYDEAIMFFKQFFNYTLKSNPYVEKALLTGITRISKESMFSDMNHIRVSTMTDKAFSEFFGFTEEEVFAAMDSQELSDKETVKAWYDGFKIGDREDMYNPWSISYYLETGRIGTYWVNTSSNEMVEKIMRSSDVDFKIHTEQLLLGKEIKVTLNEDIVFKDLDMENIRSSDKSMIWGLLFSAGYLKAVDFDLISGEYTLRVTNKEIEIMLERMFDRWFHNTVERDYKDFVKAMLSGDEENMNDALEDIAWETFSVFDVGGKTASKTAENFYHGFFLGLITTLRKEYRITSNRESGRGRYDCMLEPLDSSKKAIVIEFKVRKKKEANLKEAAEDAIEQIKKMHYAEELKHRGFSDEQILSYGIAFDGKETMVLMA